MTDDLPEGPGDPRGLAARRTAILVGLGVQALFAAVAGSLIATSQPTAGPLVREVLVPEDLVFADTQMPAHVGQRAAPVNLAEAAHPTPQRLQQGRQLFQQHCASCHGAAGRGDGAAAAALRPAPRNLTSPAGWKAGRRLTDIFRTISGGLAGTPMPSFDYLPPADRMALVHLVRALSPDPPADSPAALDSLDTQYSLSQGAQEPSVVPLSRAVERMASEAALPAGSAVGAVRADALEPAAARLFASLVVPGQTQRVLRLLQADASWRSGVPRLAALAIGGAPANGFEPLAATLPAADWRAVHRYLTLRLEGQE